MTIAEVWPKIPGRSKRSKFAGKRPPLSRMPETGRGIKGERERQFSQRYQIGHIDRNRYTSGLRGKEVSLFVRIARNIASNTATYKPRQILLPPIVVSGPRRALAEGLLNQMTINVDARDLRSAKSGDYLNELRSLAEAEEKGGGVEGGTDEEGREDEGHESGSPDSG